MSEVKAFIESGILEMYVQGNVTAEQAVEVERMAGTHVLVREELNAIEILLEDYALSQAKAVDPTIKPLLMATIDYMDRLGRGEKPSFPPRLHKNSRINDFNKWLERPDLQLREPLEEIEVHIIGSVPGVTTAIVWIRNGAPPEVHKAEYESFLVVEGTCNIIVDGKDNHLLPGDFFTIPLHLSHSVVVTSSTPCKVILERLAA